MPLIVGLTGGAASGKSTAARVFSSLGVPVFDTDAISHELTGPDGAALDAIQKTFGTDFIDKNGLVRTKMRDLVFSRSDKLSTLEEILHPLIEKELLLRIQAVNAPYVVLESALLVEKPTWLAMIDALVVIDVSEKTQVERLTKIRGLSETIAKGILNAQASRVERAKHAKFLLRNDGTVEALQDAISQLHGNLTALAERSRVKENALI